MFRDFLFRTINAVREWPRKQRVPAPSRGGRMLAAAMGPHGGGIGTTWTSDRHEQVRHFRTWTYIAVRAICNAISAEEPQAAIVLAGPEEKQIAATKGHRFSSRKQRAKSLTRLSDTEEIDVLSSRHPLVRLLDKPNPIDTSFDLWYEHELFICLTGNSYWWIPPNGMGLPAEIWVIPSPWVIPSYDGDGVIQNYELRPYGSGQTLVIPADEVIHFATKNPRDKRDGYSSLVAGNVWIDTAEQIDQTRLIAFRNGAAPSFSIDLSPEMGEPNDEELERLYAKFYARFQGVHNANTLLINAPGARSTPLNGIAPQEMGYGESGDKVRDMILAIHGVPYPIAMIVGGATFENAFEAKSCFYSQTIRPRLRWYGKVLTEKLAKRFDPRARVFWVDNQPVDSDQRNKDAQTDAAIGALTPNEWREERGRDPYPFGGDNPLVPAGLQELPYGMEQELGTVSVTVPRTPGEPQNEPLDDGVSVIPSRNGVHV